MSDGNQILVNLIKILCGRRRAILRGGIWVVLALALPDEAAGDAIPRREVLLAGTSTVVFFSIQVSGSTMGG